MTVELRDQSVICILTFLKIFSMCVMVCKHCCLTYSLLANVLSEQESFYITGAFSGLKTNCAQLLSLSEKEIE